jgi:hypothetical protein
MGQSLSSIVDCSQFKKKLDHMNYLKKKEFLHINNCPYCNIHYGKYLSTHMKECSFKGVRKSIDRFIPGTNQRYTTIFSHEASESQNKL